jgi:hypothetical protein
MVMWTLGCFPLHAVGLRLGNGIVGVVAPPGGGKSTLAALALARGIAITGDDLLAVTSEGLVVPRPGSLRVEPRRAPPGAGPGHLLVDGRRWYPLAPLPSARLGSLLFLRRGSRATLVPVQGHRRLAMILAAGFLSRYDGEAPPGWETRLLEFSAYLPVWELEVPEGVAELEAAWPDIHSLLEQSLPGDSG